MKWKDFDTNRNPYPETIQTIVDWLNFMASRWNAIDDKNRFIEQNLQPLLTGRFRGENATPALGTLLRNLGFIDDNYNISRLVFLLAEKRITYHEYILINLSKQRGWVDGEPRVNFLVLLCIYLKANDYCNVTIDLLEKLSQTEGYDNLIPNDTIKKESNRNDILYNYIQGLPLFESVDNNGNGNQLIVKDEAKEIVDFIAEKKDIIGVNECKGKNERYIYYGDLENGIFKLRGTKLPPKWKIFFPNLFASSSTINSYFNIIPSRFKGDIDPIIFYGAPGTGKTWCMQNDYINLYNEANRFVTTFHQSYSYEDFVEGLKPILDDTSKDVKYHIESGVFYNACKRAVLLAGYDSIADCIADTEENRKTKFKEAKDKHLTVLLCIDEINRGNVASIFGDLISLIEPSKRLGSGEHELIVTLPYSKGHFGVPANLFIIGTMNTADRSIQLLDSALRRRFRFREMIPNYSVFKVVDGTASNLLKRINTRIRSILNKDNQIGHSYLMNATTNKEIVTALISKIIPLLEEYFYNETGKVRFVLNENDSTKYPFYIEDKDAKEAFKSYLSINDVDDEEKVFYTINKSIVDLTEEECGYYLKHLLGENE